MSSYPIVLEDKFCIVTSWIRRPQPLALDTISMNLPLRCILLGNSGQGRFPSSVAQDGCASVPPNVSGHAVDGAGYFTILLGVF
jgi:hypothetical protein